VLSTSPSRHRACTRQPIANASLRVSIVILRTIPDRFEQNKNHSDRRCRGVGPNVGPIRSSVYNILTLLIKRSSDGAQEGLAASMTISTQYQILVVPPQVNFVPPHWSPVYAPWEGRRHERSHGVDNRPCVA
jgi:hypothetical protein